MKNNCLSYIIRMSIVAFLLTLVSCTNDAGLFENKLTERAEISLSASVGNVPAVTRMAADTYNSSLPVGMQMDVYIYDSNGISLAQLNDETEGRTSGTTRMPWVYRTSGSPDPSGKSAITLVDATQDSPQFPNKTPQVEGEDNTANIFAVCPSNPLCVVALDQTDAENIKASDLMTTDWIKPANGSKEAINLEFKHRMAKIRVTFTPDGSLQEGNMPVNFDVVNVYRSYSLNTGLNSVNSYEGNADITTEAMPLKASTLEAFFLPPQTISADTKLLVFDIVGSGDFKGISGAWFAPATSIKLESNTVYDINITVNIDFITATCNISTWEHEDLPSDTKIL